MIILLKVVALLLLLITAVVILLFKDTNFNTVLNYLWNKMNNPTKVPYVWIVLK